MLELDLTTLSTVTRRNSASFAGADPEIDAERWTALLRMKMVAWVFLVGVTGVFFACWWAQAYDIAIAWVGYLGVGAEAGMCMWEPWRTGLRLPRCSNTSWVYWSRTRPIIKRKVKVSRVRAWGIFSVRGLYYRGQVARRAGARPARQVV